MIKTKTQTELVDDLDGTAGGSVATRSFALGTDIRWIELSDENWNKLVATLDQFVNVSRKAPRGQARKTRERGTPVSAVDPGVRAFNKAARAWAISMGKIDASRGRLSEQLKQEYRDAVLNDVVGQLKDQVPAF